MEYTVKIDNFYGKVKVTGLSPASSDHEFPTIAAAFNAIQAEVRAKGRQRMGEWARIVEEVASGALSRDVP